MKKIKLSMVDRARIVDLLPKTGSIAEIEKYQGWMDDIQMTDEEKEVEKSFELIHDKDQRDNELHTWYATEKEIEIGEEFLDKLKSIIDEQDKAKVISISDPVSTYHKIMNA